MEPFAIVVGCARSGTTLVRSMLECHPDVAMVDSSNILADLARARRRFERPGGVHVDRFLDHLVRHPRFDRFGMPAEAVAAALRDRPPPPTLAEAVGIPYRLCAAAAGKLRCGEKGPEYVLDLRPISRLLPEVRVVHVVRDGRDVAKALLDSHFGTDRLVDAAVQWEARVLAGRQVGPRLGEGRYLELRYETLVSAPEPALRALCRFLGLDYHPSMLDYHRRPRAPAGGDRRVHASLALPPTPGLRDWRRDLTDAQLATVELVAGPTLAAAGYPLGGARLPPGRQALARAQEAVARARQRLQVGERARRLSATRR